MGDLIDRNLAHTPFIPPDQLTGIAKRYLDELEACFRQIPPQLSIDLSTRIGAFLAGAVHQNRQDRLVSQMALLLAISANMTADLLHAIEPARPMNLPHMDPRVHAINRAFQSVLHDAIANRIFVKFNGGAA